MLSKRAIAFLLPLLLLACLVLGGWVWLRQYTLHGTVTRVPDLQGALLDEATELLERRSLFAVVIDSVYTEELPKGSVVDQDPDAGAEVKPGRKIYLVLNASQPKMINMPRLVDLSKRQAISVLDIIGLKVKELQYKPDPCTDCVIEQQYKGEPIAPETRIRKGEAVTLVLGSGERGGRVPVPELSGLTQGEVKQVLNMASLNLGIVVSCDRCNTTTDSALARVRRQSPSAQSIGMLHMGSAIDIWLTADTAGLRPAADWNDPMKYKDSTDVVP